METDVITLIEQLESAGQGWLGEARRDVALRALRAATGQDLGVEAAAWRTWWTTGKADARQPPARAAAPSAPGGPPRSQVQLVLTPRQEEARDFLQRNGIYDPDRFEAAVSFRSVDFERDLDAGLSFYLLRHGSELHLPSFQRLDHHARRQLADILGRMLGIAVTLEAGDPPALRILDQVTVLDDPPPRILAALGRFCRQHRPDRRPWLDTHRQVWLLGDPSPEELRRRCRKRFILLDLERPGEARPPLVEEALAELRTLGALLDLDEQTLTMGISEPPGTGGALATGEAARRLVMLELLAHDRAGLLIEPDDDLEGPALPAALERLLGLRLDLPARPRSLTQLAGLLEPQLQAVASPLRLLATEDPGSGRSPERTLYGRLIAVPAAWMPALAPGGEAGLARSVTPLRLPRTPLALPRLDRWAPPGPAAAPPDADPDLSALEQLPTRTFDAECVDQAEDYEGVVEQLLALAGGALDVERIRCTDHDEERRLVLTSGPQRWTARLEGDTDWVDLPPLLECLNRLAADLGNPRSYWEINLPDSGQEATVVLGTEEETRGLPRAQPLPGWRR